jgi:hypothetical protein
MSKTSGSNETEEHIKWRAKESAAQCFTEADSNKVPPLLRSLCALVSLTLVSQDGCVNFEEFKVWYGKNLLAQQGPTQATAVQETFSLTIPGSLGRPTPSCGG